MIAVDTSGSIDERQLGRFAAEVHAILDAYNCTASVLYHDVRSPGAQSYLSLARELLGHVS